MMQNFGGFNHLRHKRRFAATDSVVETDARKNPVADSERRLRQPDETADLSEQND
jgi:hypothetical protein